MYVRNSSTSTTLNLFDRNCFSIVLGVGAHPFICKSLDQSSAKVWTSFRSVCNCLVHRYMQSCSGAASPARVQSEFLPSPLLLPELFLPLGVSERDALFVCHDQDVSLSRVQAHVSAVIWLLHLLLWRFPFFIFGDLSTASGSRSSLEH